MLYDFLTERWGRARPDRLPAGGRRWRQGLGDGKAGRRRKASQNTLTPADLAPAWRGPAPRKDAKHSA
jgi:hypothetical protein